MWEEVGNIFLHYLKFYSASLVKSFFAVCIIEYIIKKSIEGFVNGRNITKSKKRIFFMKDYIYFIFPILAAILLMELSPIHRDIAIKEISKIKYYESFASDLLIYLAEIGLLYSVFFKILIKIFKNKLKKKGGIAE